MPSKVILFTGAPPADAVTEESSTLTRFDETFRQFLHLPEEEGGDEAPAAAEPHATWRYLPLERRPLHTGFTQAHDLDESFAAGFGHGFFTTAEATSFLSEDGDGDGGLDARDDVLAQFCEQSLAKHHHHHHHHQPSGETTANDETSFMTTTNTNTTTTTEDPTGSYADPSTLHLPQQNAHLSDLEDVPPARRITALSPQTVTLNLIVGVISIAQPRTVTTRWGTTLSLVEILAGDETRSGFAVSFWLPEGGGAEGDAIARLRRQDVVLMRNVGLHVFRDKVYGQSLRKGLTRVSLLWRRDGGGHYTTRDLNRGAEGDPQRTKTRNVKDWVLRFVGRGAADAGRRKGARKSFDQMPDDTQ